MYDAQVLLPTLIGSLLSCIACICVLVSYIIYHHQQRSFRHALVLNLALAEFINSLNNSISGIWVLANHAQLTPSDACTLNGWVGQWSVQGADFSILAIAVITLLTITRKTYMPDAPLTKKILICASIWVIPTITASTAARLNELVPVSGNWCWISKNRTDLRYALGHGWRFSIVLTTIGIYIYIWFYMRRHFKNLNTARTGRSGYGSTAPRLTFRQSEGYELKSESQTNLNDIKVDTLIEIKHSEMAAPPGVRSEADRRLEARQTFLLAENETLNDKIGNVSVKSSAQSSPRSPAFPQHSTNTTPAGTSQIGGGQPRPSPQRNFEREVQRMLLLNAYPMLYIILWTPGILNRLVEASGHKSRALAIAQCSTQFVGLANAITYGFNGPMRHSLRRDFSKMFRRGGSSV